MRNRILVLVTLLIATAWMLPHSARAEEISCAEGGACQIGDLGPGGGVVFFVDSKLNSWGRYIEVAPSGWFKGRPDPNVEPYCLERAGSYDLIPDTSPLIGAGKTNTDVLLKVCPTGPAATAREYRGGGFATWSLPSKAELNEVYYEAPTEPLNEEWYWTSTATKYGAVSAFFVPLEKWDSTFDKSNDANVRPVRHFMSRSDSVALGAQKVLAETAYASCAQMNVKFSGGISKSTSVKNKGKRTTKSPYVSAKGYSLNKKLDSDRDGIACER